MIDTRNGEVLVNVTKYLSVVELEEEESHNINCDDMYSGDSAGFCTEILYLIQAQYSRDSRLVFHGYSYACKRHLIKLVLEFAVRISEKYLNVEYDKWNEEQVELENQIENHLPLTNE